MKTIIYKVYQRLKRYFYFKKNHIKVPWGSKISSDTNIGRYTRINATSHIQTCSIGSFCAIGGRLIVRSSDHFTSYLNMQDNFQSIVLKSKVKVAGKIKGKVTIGHGVWIGDSVIILGGVSVGNGAVIGAGSVVTKSILPYSIVVGNPARTIRYRFNQEIIDLIEKSKWWEWDIKKIKQNKFIFDENLENITLEEFKSLLNKIK